MLERILCKNCGQLNDFSFYHEVDLCNLQCIICGADSQLIGDIQELFPETELIEETFSKVA